MRVFAIEHDGLYLGGYSIVTAETAEEAEEMMKSELLLMKLDPNRIYKVVEINTDEKKVNVLWNGDY